MIDSRAQHRRAAGRHGEAENGDSASALETLVTYFTEGVARSAMRRVNRGVHKVVRWTMLRMVLSGIGAAVLTAGILLLLAAGVKGLEALHAPLWLAFLLIGVFATLAGLVGMKVLLSPKNEEVD